MPRKLERGRYNLPMLSRRRFAGGLLVAPLAAVLPADPADLTISEALLALRQRKLTPTELTQACLRRVEELNPRLNAVITVLGEQALARARYLRPSSAREQPL